MEIVYCDCAERDLVPADVKRRCRDALAATGLAVHIVPDLCALVARRDSCLRDWAAVDRLAVVACHSRAVRWLFHAGGAPLRERNAILLNLRTQPVEQIAQEILALQGVDGTLTSPEPSTPPTSTPPGYESTQGASGAWPPWFPVIDYSLCRNCQQCLAFCFFGVYSQGREGRVEVRQPRNCKNNCPACARVCPHVAIIFPKYTEAPINGANVTDEAIRQNSVRIDLDKALGRDAYQMLARRSRQARRQALLKDDVNSHDSGTAIPAPSSQPPRTDAGRP